MNNEIILFETNDKSVRLPVQVDTDTVWLTQGQMSELFSTTKQNVSLHINNCFREGELDRDSVVKDSLTTASDGKMYSTKYYSLDVIISVGYRVKSHRGVEFRKWATSVLKQYMLQGYAVNQKRLADLNQAVQLMQRVSSSLDASQVRTVVEKYSEALTLLDSYDHQNMSRPKGNDAVYVLTYEECRSVIDSMRFGNESDLTRYPKIGQTERQVLPNFAELLRVSSYCEFLLP